MKARFSSYDDEIDYVVNSNTSLLMAGFGLLFVYVALVLGNVNILEQRVALIKNSDYIFLFAYFFYFLSQSMYKKEIE